ncbi:hypothetical protein P168DRAFT_323967 [Aspergillus campestris IBT 28561]|uniref:Uncharacterized protein n=1 Tax=Aspergillus campestris (strain IBT 28561) TaxID=1392248 RepID=A0A2I1DGC5_ASPC2|nr:uncharacterized protein P168DRAFT_323967 [Aspergillus campestris IBT 28561]PKY08922.1 hypothetical protein P168DRAFT_323967 [Aspergillus campestris IBT 28561]
MSSTIDPTGQDIRKAESKVSQAHGGNPPKESDVSALKSHISQTTDKKKDIEQTKANLPLPEQPPVASDWSSADARTVNVGSGRTEGPVSGEANSALREPATAGSSVRESGSELHKNTAPTSNVGRQGKDNLDGLPKDALAR